MDIVEQLRKSANTIYKQDGYTFRLGLQKEAADEIERLREALQHIIRWHDQLSPADIAKAKAALEKE
jgi:rRNA maturation endonuclease Nob1